MGLGSYDESVLDVWRYCWILYELNFRSQTWTLSLDWDTIFSSWATIQSINVRIQSSKNTAGKKKYEVYTRSQRRTFSRPIDVHLILDVHQKIMTIRSNVPNFLLELNHTCRLFHLLLMITGRGSVRYQAAQRTHLACYTWISQITALSQPMEWSSPACFEVRSISRGLWAAEHANDSSTSNHNSFVIDIVYLKNLLGTRHTRRHVSQHCSGPENWK